MSEITGLPRAVKVGGFSYSVKESNEFTQGAGVYALVDHRRLEIHIGVEPPTDPLRVRESFLHELVHAVANVYGLGAGEPLAEPWAEALGSGLFQVLRDNPEATAFILGPSLGAVSQEDGQGCGVHRLA